MLGQNQIALHIDIDQDLDKTGANITGSKDRLTQALLNLLDNAIKYSPEGSAVHLGIRRRGDYADMYVRDQGQGIPEEDIPHIFNRFYRADKSRSRAKANGLRSCHS